MMTLPPAQTLGAALAQATAGAAQGLLAIVVICAPVLLLWLGCRWLEQHLPLDWPPTPGLPAGNPVAEDIEAATPTMPALPRLRAALRRRLDGALMTPLTLSDLELADMAQVTTFPALPAAHPDPQPAPRPDPRPASPPERPSAFPLYQPPATPPHQPGQPEYAPWDNWPPRPKPGQYSHRYIFIGDVLVRVASLHPYVAIDSVEYQPFVWN